MMCSIGQNAHKYSLHFDKYRSIHPVHSQALCIHKINYITLFRQIQGVKALYRRLYQIYFSEIDEFHWCEVSVGFTYIVR